MKSFLLKNVMITVAIFSFALYSPLTVSGSGDARIFTGGAHSIYLSDDGNVWEWGDRVCTTQFGIDGGIPRLITDADGKALQGIVSVSAGHSHTLFLKHDGSVWACGHNKSGKLGDGSTQRRSFPVRVVDREGQPFKEVSAIAAGRHHSIALRNDGTVWAWGNDFNGQLGNIMRSKTTTPIRTSMPSGDDFPDGISIAAGERHSAAITKDGNIWVWGSAHTDWRMALRPDPFNQTSSHQFEF